MKKGLLYKFLIAPLIFLLLYIGTLVPFVSEGLRTILQFLPQIVSAAISSIITFLGGIAAGISNIIAFFSPGLAKAFSSVSNAFIHLLASIFTAFSQLFNFIVDLAGRLVGGTFYLFGKFWGIIASTFIQLFSILVFLLEMLLALLILVAQLFLYVLQIMFSSFFTIINKILSFFPILRDIVDYLMNTSAGRLIREFFGLFFNKSHRLGARYAWQNFLKKLKSKGT
ncbi:MAG: hypothetical protein EOL98_08360 [Negativicutes bacterium]|nr:hypothetical protein [Negativicutes bacterium]